MATNQTSLFDGVTCTPLTSELGASNTFLFLVGMVVSSSVCVALEEVVVAPDCFYDTLCFHRPNARKKNTIHCVSPIFKVLVHPFSTL